MFNLGNGTECNDSLVIPGSIAVRLLMLVRPCVRWKGKHQRQWY